MAHVMTATLEQPKPTDGTAIVQIDPTLGPYAGQLRERHAYYLSVKRKIDEAGGLLGQISQGHTYFGLNRGELYGKPGVWYREWAPGGAPAPRSSATSTAGTAGRDPMVRDEFGVWSLFLPDEQVRPAARRTAAG